MSSIEGTKQDQTPTDQQLAQEHYGRLDAAARDLTGQLQAMRAGGASAENVEKATAEVSKLRKDYTDAIPFLPGYDRRTFDNQIRDIEAQLESLRASLAPKSKFAFKRKTAKAASPSPSPAPTQNPPTSSSPPLAVTEEAAHTSGLLISSHSYCYLSLSSLSVPWSSASDLTISDLDHCIVNLVPSEANPNYPSGLNFTALHVRNLTDTVLLLPIITGSALLHDMKNCVIALGSRQFRIHTSSRVDVYISISSNPIIEHCSAMRFANYPPSLTRSRVIDLHQADATGQDKYSAVQDFSHIRATPSPNWSLLSQDMTIQEGRWPLSAVSNVDEVLQNLLPSQ